MGFSLKRALGGALETFGGDIGNVVAGAVGVGSDQLAAEDNWKLQKKAADYKYAQDLNMWNLVNAYNDPAAQMERLQKAGLNPNLVYGGGNVTGNTSGSGPEYANIDARYTDHSTQRQQLALAIKEHQQRITNQAIQNDLARQRLVLAERDADRSDALAQAQISAYKAGLGLTDARIDSIQHPKSAIVEAMRNEANSWKDPVKKAVEKFVDWAIVTKKPNYKKFSIVNMNALGD